jgi:hypothetical protein
MVCQERNYGESDPVGWLDCVNALSENRLQRLGNDRWYSRQFCSWLHENKLVGLYEDCVAFPVHSKSRVVGLHYRLEDGSWRYHPQGIRTAPLILGDLATANQVHVFESQWDLFAFVDRTDIYPSETVSFIATRGASNARLVSDLLREGISVCSWPQNDAAGQKWLNDLCAYANPQLAKAVIPVSYKDMNEWTAAGARAEDIYAALWRNELVYELKPKSVDLTVLLEDVCAYLKRFVVFTSEAQPTAIALWVAHTWTIDAFDYTPYLQITSPEKQCGKSRVLDCLEPITSKPWRAISPSEAVLFRKIDSDKPTLLLDETDTLFSDGNGDRSELLRSLLNAGFERK